MRIGAGFRMPYHLSQTTLVVSELNKSAQVAIAGLCASIVPELAMSFGFPGVKVIAGGRFVTAHYN